MQAPGRNASSGSGRQAEGSPIILSPQQLASYQTGSQGDRPMVVAATEQALADPETREIIKQQAMQVGGQVVVVAKHYGRQSIAVFQDYIQQGPKGVSVLCFIGGVGASCVGALGLSNVGNVALDPFHYILNIYMFVFGLVTTLIEADTDRVGTMMTPFDKLAEPITRMQAFLHEECRLLTRLRGRGFFYLYQGTLMVSQCFLCLLFVGGLYIALMGVICILMSFGIKPDLDYMFADDGNRYEAVPGNRYEAVPGQAEEGKMGVLQRHAPEVSPLDVEFPKAVAAWTDNKDKCPGKAKRELYALHQQATVGDCREPKPSGMFNGNAKEQWRLWTRLNGMALPDVKREFIRKLRKENIDF